MSTIQVPYTTGGRPCRVHIPPGVQAAIIIELIIYLVIISYHSYHRKLCDFICASDVKQQLAT